ncbi:MAG: ROK family protein [Chloroflexi bacterium]|nr:ROK family protein [Chloroflexota bacterium]
MAQVLGIDLGGTKVLAGVVDVDTGRVVSKAKKRSRAEHGPQDLVERLVQVANQALAADGVDRRGVRQIGIGVAGQIDRERGIVIAAPNLANMTDMRLAELVQKEVGLPVKLFNDVEAAGAGEASFGAGRGRTDFVVVFVGTGIGGAIYRDGRPYAGATHTAGELGHMIVAVSGRLCGCGGFGHLEAYASRTAIVRSILAGLHAGRQSVLREIATQINPNDPGGSGIRSRAIAQALNADDALTHEMLMVAADYLAAGLASIANFYNPPLIVLGGGLVEAVDLFFTAVAARTRNAALEVPGSKIEIAKAGLGDYSGIVGAAVLASRG